MCLSINNWDNFITNIKYFYDSTKRKHNLKWFKNVMLLLLTPVIRMMKLF
ncbi:hypothetical protein CPTSV76_186 [Enterobacteria phage SV76]|nr:hypothetical protein CPTSV76_186 [Enterobacteria phage SV76]